VLTTETHAQALDRACEGEANHGYQWACSALDMALLVRELGG
jgi:6,7-dimethyl-8-ribityllumazine synthase